MAIDERMRLLSPDEAAERLHVKVGTLAMWRSQGKGPRWVKLNRKVLYRPEAVDEFIRSLPEFGEPKKD